MKRTHGCPSRVRKTLSSSAILAGIGGPLYSVAFVFLYLFQLAPALGLTLASLLLVLGGLLSLAVDPGFKTNHFLYLAYDYDLGKENYRLRIVRFREKENHLIEPRTNARDEDPAWS